MKWTKGRLEDNGPNGLTQEYICEHHIGHWRWPHACDRCCLRDDYPGREGR